MRPPALVAAPLGIVNAVELTFAAMFIALLIWSLAHYLYVSFGHLHMHTPGEKVYASKAAHILFLRTIFFKYIISNNISVVSLLKVASKVS